MHHRSNGPHERFVSSHAKYRCEHAQDSLQSQVWRHRHMHRHHEQLERGRFPLKTMDMCLTRRKRAGKLEVGEMFLYPQRIADCASLSHFSQDLTAAGLLFGSPFGSHHDGQTWIGRPVGRGWLAAGCFARPLWIRCFEACSSKIRCQERGERQ
jgi:hypothetical protein